MKRKMLSIVASILAVLMLSVVLYSAEPLELNGDFENVETVPENNVLHKRLAAIDFKTESPLILPSKWTLNPTSSAKNCEFRIISDSSQAQSGKNCVYLKGHLMAKSAIDVSEGDEMEISFYAKAPEKSTTIFYFYCYGKDEEGKIRNIGALNFRSQPETEWKQYSATIKIPLKVRDKKLERVIPAFTNLNGVYIDNFKLIHKKAEKKDSTE